MSKFLLAFGNCQNTFENLLNIKQTFGWDIQFASTKLQYFAQSPIKKYAGKAIEKNGKVYLGIGYIYSDGINQYEQCLFGNALIERLVKAHEKYGSDVFAKLQGAFICFIYDINNDELLIGNDRYGLVPAYYFYDKSSNVWIISSDIDLIKKISAPLTYDKTAIQELVLFDFLIGDRTLYNEIKCYNQGSNAKIKYDSLDLHQYWNYKSGPSLQSISYSDAFEKGKYLLKKAINKHELPGLRALVPLSGGLDSRVIVGYRKVNKQRIDGTVSYGEEGCNDLRYSNLVAEKLELLNIPFHLSPQKMVDNSLAFLSSSNGMLGIHHGHSMIYMDSLQNSFDYKLSGFLGDVVAGGFVQEKNKISNNSANKISIISKYLLEKFCYQFEKNHQLSKYFDLTAIKDDLNEILNQQTSLEDLGDYYEYFFYTQKGRRQVNNIELLSNPKLETLYPFMDYDLFDFMTSLPLVFRKNQFLYRNIIATQLSEISDIPSTTTYGRIKTSKLRNEISKIKKSFWKISQSVDKYYLRSFFSVYDKNINQKYDRWLMKELLEWKEQKLKKLKTRNIINEQIIDLVNYSFMHGINSYYLIIYQMITIEIYIEQQEGK